MDSDGEVIIMDSTLNATNNLKTSATCRVCGIDKAQSHYGTVCCVSCKMFFRRNAQLDLNDKLCVFNGRCNITAKSRKTCRYCRLKKCFVAGMQKELLRASHNRQGTRQKQPARDSTSSLSDVGHRMNSLKSDRSLLSPAQWTDLSNIINLFNRKAPIDEVRKLLAAPSTFPVKQRLKTAASMMLTIINTMYRGVIPIVENLSHFENLSVNDRSLLIERNIRNIGGYCGIMVNRDADVNSTAIFRVGFPLVYGQKLMDQAVYFDRKTDGNGTLIKLLIPVLAFSTGCDIIILQSEHDSKDFIPNNKFRLLSNGKQILDVQNEYVEILFKYMVFQYGYREAALRFAALIKSSLDQSKCSASVRDNQQHEQLVHTVITEVENSLTI